MDIMNLRAEIFDANYVAGTWHATQFDKAGLPFFMHPLRVSYGIAEAGRLDLVPAALLHDVIEDTILPFKHLISRGYSDLTLRVVLAMTRREDESYADYIDRVALDPDATALKRVDILDNLDPSRKSGRAGLTKRYRAALEVLGHSL